MRDLTDRALDTASALGATLRRRPGRPPPRREHRHQDRARRGRRLGRDRGLRRPRPRRRRVGLRELSHDPDHGGGRSRRRAGRPHRPGVGDGAARARRPRRPAARHGPLRDARRRGPVRGPARRARSAILLEADAAARGVKGVAFTESMYPPTASGRRSRRRTAASPSRSSPTSAPASRPTPSTATSTSGARYPGRRRRLPAAGYEYIRGLDLAGQRRAARRGGRRAARRAPQCPPGRRTIVLRPVAAVPPDPRELRPPDRARPRLRHRGRRTRARAS